MLHLRGQHRSQSLSELQGTGGRGATGVHTMLSIEYEYLKHEIILGCIRFSTQVCDLRPLG